MSITMKNFRINRALRQVRNVFRDRARWVQGSYHVLPSSAELKVERFCVRGALMEATDIGDGSDLFLADKALLYPEARAVLDATATRLHNIRANSSMYVNDTLGYDAVMHMLDTAISDTQHGEQTNVDGATQ